MTQRNSVLLYVTNPTASAAFYSGLLGREPVEASPSFVMFILESGLALGLWSRDGVVPAAMSGGGGCELGFPVADTAAVDATHDAWRAKGAAIILPPTELDFGRSFVAIDPDGHRLRVYAVTA
jgi:catechol 2,3-dioxygenase-like lactoylglutathione lyase family enzyme